MKHLAPVVLAICAMIGGMVQAQEVSRQEVEKALREGVLQVWFPRAIDKEQGGFLCNFDAQWKAVGNQPKTIVFQSRMVWVASRAAEKYANDPRYLEAARHGFQFLRTTMWDKENGGWFWYLDRSGKTTPQWQGIKHAYGVGFGVYASATYYRVTKDPQGLEMAKEGFGWLEKHSHDSTFGGYNELLTRQGAPILDDASNPLARDRDCIGTRIGYKSMNTHIHLLEACTALYQVWPDPLVKSRLAELLGIVRDKVVAPPGAMHQFFNRNWAPVPDLDSVGHDIETAYLLLEAAEALGMKDDPKTVATAKSLVDHALEYAWDKSNGGFFEKCGVFGPVHDKSKIWWSQAEGLNALLLMSRQFPQDKRNYRQLFTQQWRYIEKNLMDKQYGEWYPDGLDAGGKANVSKGNEWKAGYHVGRALFNAVEWMESGKDQN